MHEAHLDASISSFRGVHQLILQVSSYVVVCAPIYNCSFKSRVTLHM